METREIPLTPGAFGWAVATTQYPLPPDLPHRTLVKIIENRAGTTTVTVEAQNGKRWTLLRSYILPRLRYLYAFENKWYPEKSDRAQEILWAHIDREWDKLEMQRRSIEQLYWQVRRSGNQKAVHRLEHRLQHRDPARTSELILVDHMNFQG